MTIRQYLVVMLLGTLLCWFAWVLVLLNVDPFVASTTGLVLFFVTLFFSLFGTLSMMSFGLYRFFAREIVPMYRLVEQSFHHASLVSALFVLLLFLQAVNMLTVLTLILFGILVTLIVTFSLSTRHRI